MPKNYEIKYQGKMFEIVHFEPKPGVKFETAVRAPGVRLLIENMKDGKLGLLMTKELRHGRNVSEYDFRLPGGKVFDTLEEFNNAKEKNDSMEEHAMHAAKLEAKQEVGVQNGEFTQIALAKAGGSVEWDLYYFLVTNTKIGEQELEEHEKGEIEVVLLTPQEIFDKLKDREIKEGRSADVLWTWLVENNFIEFKN